jgi:hypothetical protein
LEQILRSELLSVSFFLVFGRDLKKFSSFFLIFKRDLFRKMSVVGLDFGSQTSFCAIARQGGIEVVANEYSKVTFSIFHVTSLISSEQQKPSSLSATASDTWEQLATKSESQRSKRLF